MKTFDRTADVLVVEAVGKTRYRTPDGYLYCEDVRIASTKDLLYRADEMQKVQSQSGMVLMQRPPEVLFDQQTLASFQGKPITNSHPANLVGPRDWKHKSVGVVLNPRRGEGSDKNYLMADMLITDDEAIKSVESGKVEVSCGYDQDHEQVKPGLGRFTRITGNHVALVDRGRCGPQCAIGDSGETTMSKTIIDRLRTAFQSNDEKIFDKELQAAEAVLDSNEQRVIVEVSGTGGTAAHDAGVKAVEDAVDPIKGIQTTLDAIMQRLDKLETSDTFMKKEEEKKEEEKHEKEETCDEAIVNDEETLDALTLGHLRIEFQDVVGKAEILSPGIKLPTFDATANSKKTIADQMCGLRKSAMDSALSDTKRAHFVTTILGIKPDIEKMSCDQMTLAFNAASELARMANNAPKVSFDHAMFPGGPMTAEKLQMINEANRRKAS